MIIKPRIRGFVCTTAHPEGCAQRVRDEIALAREWKLSGGPKRVLVIGASTGYGLSSRIVSAFSCGAATVGVFFERPSTKGKPASPGWYNSAAFENAAHDAGLYAKSVNGDAFSNEIKSRVLETIREDLGGVDLVVYSLASPRRTDPESGETYKSVLKPIGEKYTNKTLDTDKEEVRDITIDPAEPEEIEATVKVMGGEDWEIWMRSLREVGLLAPDAKTVAFSYIGPELTWPIYTNGTIGRAKEDLERASSAISENIGCEATVSVNKAVVTQASSAIPVVPLYISLLFRVMKERGLHESCIHQMIRLFHDRLYADAAETDERGRIRLDDREMREDVQKTVAELWPRVTTENLRELSDYDGYRSEFLALFGFGVDAVDYGADVDVEVSLPGEIA